LLPGLADMTKSLRKNIKELFDKILLKVGETEFLGAFWISILRTNSQENRIYGLKYLQEKGTPEKIKIDSDSEEEIKEVNQEIIQ